MGFMSYDPLNAPTHRWERWMACLSVWFISAVLFAFYHDQRWETWIACPLGTLAGAAFLSPKIIR